VVQNTGNPCQLKDSEPSGDKGTGSSAAVRKIGTAPGGKKRAEGKGPVKRGDYRCLPEAKRSGSGNEEQPERSEARRKGSQYGERLKDRITEQDSSKRGGLGHPLGQVKQYMSGNMSPARTPTNAIPKKKLN